tara:strand:+ start:476 stop:631 length:156 start_codon:yes stop_codon:yes gene_type:complete
MTIFKDTYQLNVLDKELKILEKTYFSTKLWTGKLLPSSPRKGFEVRYKIKP